MPFLHHHEELKIIKNAYKRSLRHTNYFAYQRFCVPYPIEQQFQLSEQERTKEIKFQHPTTQVKHTLYFQMEEAFELPEKVAWGEKLYVTSAVYEIVPTFNKEDRLEFDSSLSYKPKPINSYAPQSTNSISMIGGARGTIIIFISKKEKNYLRKIMDSYYIIVTQK